MEWCRMYKLRIVVWFLGCVGLSVAMPDIVRQGSRISMSERDHKLTELLKSLNSFSSESNHIVSTSSEKNSSENHTYTPTSPPPTATSGKMLTVAGDKVPGLDVESIRTYQDFYRMLGTQEGMDYIRTQYGPNGLQRARAKFGGIQKGMDEVRMANAHYLRVRTRARCNVPVPQVVRVKDYYPDPSKEYIPRCTVLHRCGDTTGCCDSDAFRCVENAVQEVALSFYTISFGKGGLTSDNSIKQLLFQNHTSCRCQPVNDLPRMQNHLLDGGESPSKSNCLDCPVPFTSRIYKDGRCGCDCFDKQRPCLRIKRGRDPLSEIERRCVLANQCHIPACEYGQYDYDTGFCPRRHDEDQHKTHHRRPNHISTNHRWAFIERD